MLHQFGGFCTVSEHSDKGFGKNQHQRTKDDHQHDAELHAEFHVIIGSAFPFLTDAVGNDVGGHGAVNEIAKPPSMPFWDIDGGCYLFIAFTL